MLSWRAAFTIAVLALILAGSGCGDNERQLVDQVNSCGAHGNGAKTVENLEGNGEAGDGSYLVVCNDGTRLRVR